MKVMAKIRLYSSAMALILLQFTDITNLVLKLKEGLKKSAEFSALFKTHPPHLQSAERKIKITWLFIFKQK